MNLIERIRRKMIERGLEQKDLVVRLGVSKGTISNWLNGRNKGIDEESLSALAKVLKTTPAYLRYGFDQSSGPDRNNDESQSGHDEVNEQVALYAIDAWDSNTPLSEDEVELPLFREVELSAGSGCTHVQENHGAKLRFARSTLRRQQVAPSDAACCFITGDSMEPILPDGTTVGVNTADTAIIDGKMYAIDHGGLLRVKYLYRLPGGGIRIRSANREEYPDEDLTPERMEGFRVIGRVFWYSVLL